MDVVLRRCAMSKCGWSNEFFGGRRRSSGDGPDVAAVATLRSSRRDDKGRMISRRMPEIGPCSLSRCFCWYGERTSDGGWTVLADFQTRDCLSPRPRRNRCCQLSDGTLRLHDPPWCVSEPSNSKIVVEQLALVTIVRTFHRTVWPRSPLGCHLPGRRPSVGCPSLRTHSRRLRSRRIDAKPTTRSCWSTCLAGASRRGGTLSRSTRTLYWAPTNENSSTTKTSKSTSSIAIPTFSVIFWIITELVNYTIPNTSVWLATMKSWLSSEYCRM